MKSVSADAFGGMESMADLNIRIWGTFEDKEGMTRVVDVTQEKVDGLFASTFKWEEEKCEQNIAELGLIEPMNWAKIMEIVGRDAGVEIFKKAVAYAADRLNVNQN
jgi:hypothetical protein